MKYSSEEVEKRRQYLVVKANELVQRSRYDMTLQAMKSVAYICSLIKPRDEFEQNKSAWQLEYQFKIKDYCMACGIDYNAGAMYNDIKATLKGLRDKSMWLELPDGSETTVAWLDKVTTNKRSGTVSIRIDRDMAPFLLDLKERFTQYQLVEVLGMKSSYSIKLFELLRSYEGMGGYTFQLDDLKRRLMIDTIPAYRSFPEFRRRILEPAVKEINNLTDTLVEYEVLFRGKNRGAYAIRFTVMSKDVLERWKAIVGREKQLDDGRTDKHFHPEQLSLDEFRDTKTAHREMLQYLSTAFIPAGGNVSEFSLDDMERFYTLLKKVPESKLPTGTGYDSIWPRRIGYLAEKYLWMDSETKGKSDVERRVYLEILILMDTNEKLR